MSEIDGKTDSSGKRLSGLIVYHENEAIKSVPLKLDEAATVGRVAQSNKSPRQCEGPHYHESEVMKAPRGKMSEAATLGRIEGAIMTKAALEQASIATSAVKTQVHFSGDAGPALAPITPEIKPQSYRGR